MDTCLDCANHNRYYPEIEVCYCTENPDFHDVECPQQDSSDYVFVTPKNWFKSFHTINLFTGEITYMKHRSATECKHYEKEVEVKKQCAK